MEILAQVITVVIISLGILGLMVLVEHALDGKAARDHKQKLERREQYRRVWKSDDNWWTG